MRGPLLDSRAVEGALSSGRRYVSGLLRRWPTAYPTSDVEVHAWTGLARGTRFSGASAVLLREDLHVAFRGDRHWDPMTVPDEYMATSVSLREESLPLRLFAVRTLAEGDSSDPLISAGRTLFVLRREDGLLVHLNSGLMALALHSRSSFDGVEFRQRPAYRGWAGALGPVVLSRGGEDFAVVMPKMVKP